MNRESLKAWCDQEPDPNHIKTNDDGSEYIDIVDVENLLSELDLLWGTEDFKFRVIESNGRIYGSASVVLTLTLLNQKRRLVGAATVMLAEDITHSEPTLLSEAQKNAAKKLGRKFGKYLNDRGTQQEFSGKRTKKMKKVDKMPPDKAIMEKYLAAVCVGDQITIEKLTSAYDIKVPENA